MPKVKLEKGLSKPTVRNRLKSDSGSPATNKDKVKHCKKEGSLNFTELNFSCVPCFEIFFQERFLPLLLDNPERTFKDIFKSIEIQWQSLCPTLKAFYETRYVLYICFLDLMVTLF